MCLAQGPQRSDAGEARTRGPSVWSQALYHWATALPYQCFVFGLSLVNKKYNLPRLRRRKSSRTIAERIKVRKCNQPFTRFNHLSLFIRLIEVQVLYNIYIYIYIYIEISLHQSKPRSGNIYFWRSILFGFYLKIVKEMFTCSNILGKYRNMYAC